VPGNIVGKSQVIQHVFIGKPKGETKINGYNIRPLHDRVIVRRIEEGEQVRGGIIIPDTAKEKPQEGQVAPSAKGKYKGMAPVRLWTSNRVTVFFWQVQRLGDQDRWRRAS